MTAKIDNALFPVILDVPDNNQDMPQKDLSVYLRRRARQAVLMSAEISGYKLGGLIKDSNNAPRQADGYWWSLSHKQDYVAGVAAKQRIGIDIEKIHPVSAKLFQRIAKDSEWGLSLDVTDVLFFRYWTAKEAVLKAAGIGLRDLSKCSITIILDDTHLVVSYKGKEHMIEHVFYNDHIISIVNDGLPVRWRFPFLEMVSKAQY